MTDTAALPGSAVPTPAQRRAARRRARQAERARHRADIDTRARILAARQTGDPGATHWSLHVAIGLVAALWAAGCVWLFAEQTRFAAHLGFAVPQVFPVLVDGGAFVAALLAYAISLTGRTASGSRLFSATANLLSAAANGAGAWFRAHDATAVVVAALVPLVLVGAFHLILGEIRLRVRIRRGLPADKAPPALRPARLLFAGRWAIYEWRAAGLALTDPLPPLPADEHTDRINRAAATVPPRVATSTAVTQIAETAATTVQGVGEGQTVHAAADPAVPDNPAADRTARPATTETFGDAAATDTAHSTPMDATVVPAVAAAGLASTASPGASGASDRTDRTASADPAPGTAATGVARTPMVAAGDGPAVEAPGRGGSPAPAVGDRIDQSAAADVAPVAVTTTAATTAMVAAAGPGGSRVQVATLDGRRKSAAAAAAARTARAEAALARARDYVAAFTTEHGCEPTGREFGEHVGRSEGWGLSVLRKLRESTPEEESEEEEDDGAG